MSTEERPWAKAASCKPSRETSPEVLPADDMTSDFQSPDQRGSTSLWRKPLGLGHFVTAALSNSRTGAVLRILVAAVSTHVPRSIQTEAQRK